MSLETVLIIKPLKVSVKNAYVSSLKCRDGYSMAPSLFAPPRLCNDTFADLGCSARVFSTGKFGRNECQGGEAREGGWGETGEGAVADAMEKDSLRWDL